MRKSQAKKLPLAPDPRFNDKQVTRFVNNIMWEGKKSVAFDIFYNSLEKVAKQTGEDGYEVWKRALSNVTPAVEVRSRRIGGATFQYQHGKSLLEPNRTQANNPQAVPSLIEL